MFNGKIHYKWSFSIAMLNYQRVNQASFSGDAAPLFEPGQHEGSGCCQHLQGANGCGLADQTMEIWTCKHEEFCQCSLEKNTWDFFFSLIDIGDFCGQQNGETTKLCNKKNMLLLRSLPPNQKNGCV